MTRSALQLRQDAVHIWQAGVDAVRSEQLVRNNVQVDDKNILVAGKSIALEKIRRIVAVGAGKAGAGMAAGLEQTLGEELMRQKDYTGWINVPADCVRQLQRTTLHSARPAGVNEPTAEGVAGTQKILEILATLTSEDLCFCLISGGGSALLPAPVAGIRLEDKQTVTSHLSAAGANIEELNVVRKQLSAIKGGGLARRCRAKWLFSLIISDVLGDPLDAIASGPTAPDRSTPQLALEILNRFQAQAAGISPRVFDHLQQQNSHPGLSSPITCQVHHMVIGNNALAVEAAGVAADKLGYSPALMAATKPEGQADDVGRHLARKVLQMCHEPGPDCFITGGEPVVKLVDAQYRGRGGRNQQLALSSLVTLSEQLTPEELLILAERFVILSGGTDGEDGPTDAAGAVLDKNVMVHADQLGLSPKDFLQRNDAYHFFKPLGGLILSGPTHTNVCDLRVVVVNRDDDS